MRPAEIDLRIDELVLHGFAAEDRGRIGQAVQRELAQLLEEAAAGGALAPSLITDGAVATSDGGVVNLAARATPEATGAQVAQAVFRAFAGVAAPPGAKP
jgi:hypothetical protein